MSQNKAHHSKTKHIDVKYHFVHHCVANHTVKSVYLRTSKMVGDLLTKPRRQVLFEGSCRRLVISKDRIEKQCCRVWVIGMTRLRGCWGICVVFRKLYSVFVFEQRKVKTPLQMSIEFSIKTSFTSKKTHIPCWKTWNGVGSEDKLSFLEFLIHLIGRKKVGLQGVLCLEQLCGVHRAWFDCAVWVLDHRNASCKRSLGNVCSDNWVLDRQTNSWVVCPWKAKWLHQMDNLQHFIDLWYSGIDLSANTACVCSSQSSTNLLSSEQHETQDVWRCWAFLDQSRHTLNSKESSSTLCWVSHKNNGKQNAKKNTHKRKEYSAKSHHTNAHNTNSIIHENLSVFRSKQLCFYPQ